MTQNHSDAIPAAQRAQLERSQLKGALVSLGAWVVVVLPIILMSILIFAWVMEPSQGMAAPARIALIFAGAALLFCMIATPHLLGQAVRFGEKAMWRAALITGIPTVGVILFFIFRWLSNLG